MTRVAMLLAGWLASAGLALAAEQAAETATDEAGEAVAHAATTRHSVRIDGQTIKYTATVGWLILEDEEGRPQRSWTTCTTN